MAPNIYSILRIKQLKILKYANHGWGEERGSIIVINVIMQKGLVGIGLGKKGVLSLITII